MQNRRNFAEKFFLSIAVAKRSTLSQSFNKRSKYRFFGRTIFLDPAAYR